MNKARTAIDWQVKEAKYRALKISDSDKLVKKIAKRVARKDVWYGILKAVQRYENFKESEDHIPFDVEKEFGHHVSKLHVMESINKE